MTAAAHRPGVVTNPQLIADIRRRVEYGRLPWYQQLTRRPPPGWGGIRPTAAQITEPEEYHAVLNRVLAARPAPSSTCTACGFQREEHRGGHCPGGDPGDTFTAETEPCP